MPDSTTVLASPATLPTVSETNPNHLPLARLFDGERVELGGGNPILLQRQDRMSIVEQGAVDVFAVRVEGGVAVGRRHHVLRVDAGQALFEPRDDGAPIALIGVAIAGTVLRRGLRGGRPARDDDARRALSGLVAAWVDALGARIAPDVPPKDLIPLEPGARADVGAGQHASTLGGVLWVRRAPDAETTFLGALPVTGAGYFPVSNRTWLSSVEPAVFSAAATDSWLADDPSLAGLDDFHRAALTVIEQDIARTATLDASRLERQILADQATARRAVATLAAVLDGPPAAQGSRASDGSEGTDPLPAACRLVGDALGLSIADVPPAFRANRDPKDRLSDIARASRIRLRQVMLRGDWWRRDHGPLLGLIEASKHPVALIPVSATRYEMVDPATGERTTVTAASAAALSPFAQTFYRPLPAGALTGRDLLRLGIHGLGRDIVAVVLMGIAGALMGLLTPVAMQHLVDTIIPESQRGQLFQLSAALVVSALSVATFTVVRSVALLRIEGRMNMSVQSAIWDRLLNLPVGFFRRYTAGDLATRAMAINDIRQIVSGVVVSAMISGIFSVVHFGLLFHYSWKLALLAAGLTAALIGITMAVSLYSLRFQREVMEAEGSISGMVLQFISGIAKLRVAGAESRAFAAWSERFGAKKRAAFKAGTVQNVLQVLQAMFPVLASMAVFAMALHLVQDARRAGEPGLTTGAFLAFNASFGTFLGSAIEMGTALMSALSIVPIYRRARPIMDTLPEISVAKAHPGVLKGEIEVHDVSFRYADDAPPILKSVSIDVAPGDYIAIVGPSGSGKSTLLRLLMGFERPTLGSIHYDGQDLGEVDAGEVRRQIGIVAQQSKLRTGTLFENIVGSAQLSLEQAWEAARMAGFAEDVEAMPMGMHTMTDSEGTTLSGGQKQRLMIARAIVRRPRLIFFDEATSALDNRTQAIVSRSLDRLQATRIVIAHRLSTIVNAHRIYVMEAGQIVQAGTFDELMRQPGAFAALARRQIA